MVLPTSGAISASQINAEFGDATPVSLQEYRGREVWKPEVGFYNLPSTPLRYSDFYGVYGTYFIDVVVISGGGGGGRGGNNGGGGGGGCGGYGVRTLRVVRGLTYSIEVPAGGAGSSSIDSPGGDGGQGIIRRQVGDSTNVFFLVSGGLGGGASRGIGFTRNGIGWGILSDPNSQSGGGGGGANPGGSGNGGAGYSSGGAGRNSSTRGSGGGGGGRGGTGASAPSSGTGGAGGTGLNLGFASFNSAVLGGGGGGGPNAGGAAGSGGGGAGSTGTGGGGTANTGGGGGGSSGGTSGGSGGSGVILIRYLSPGRPQKGSGGSVPVTNDGTFYLHQFNGTGTYTA